MRSSILILFILLLGCTRQEPIHPGLLFSDEDIPALIEKSKTPDGQAIMKQLEKRLSEPPDALYVGAWAAGHAFLYQLTGEREHAARARQYAEMTMGDSLIFYSLESPGQPATSYKMWDTDYKAIYRAPNIIGIALAYDLCYDAWEPGFRESVAAELEDKACKLLDGGGTGWNPNAWSNWHGITKGAGSVAMAALLNDPGASPRVKEYFDKATREMLLHLSYLGERCWTPEGFDYLRYETCNGVLPFVQVYFRITGHHLSEYAPNLSWILPFHAMQSVFADNTFHVPDYGPCGPDWNTNRWRSGDLVMGMATVPENYLPAAKWVFDQAFGLKGDSTYNIFKPYDAIFALVNYPAGTEPANPGKILNKCWVDTTGGYYVFRNNWRDRNDMVTTITSNRLARPASHSHKEAGSFRLLGLGGKWAVRGRKSPGVRNQILENVVLVEGATQWRGGHVTHYSCRPDGSGSVTIDLKNTYLGGEKFRDSINIGVTEAYRSFAVEYINDSTSVYAVYDKITGGGKKTWQFFAGEKMKEVTPDGFMLQSDDGATFRATFIVPEHVRIDTMENRIHATGGDEYFVLFTLQKNQTPQLYPENHSEIHVYGRTISLMNERITVNDN